MSATEISTLPAIERDLLFRATPARACGER